jgi:hypothetical protein
MIFPVPLHFSQVCPSSPLPKVKEVLPIPKQEGQDIFSLIISPFPLQVGHLDFKVITPIQLETFSKKDKNTKKL